jgi:hypothetical protein
MLRLDLAGLQRLGFLRGLPATLSWSDDGEEVGSITVLASSQGLRLLYRSCPSPSESRDVDELVPFLWTPTRSGGQRRWFQCLGCSRRCRVLYAGIRFRCRRCHRLRYSSQTESPSDRATSAMLKIARRLDSKADYDDLP